jgi:SAM-dependent methyltransferase
VEALSSGRVVLELASGSGHALCELAARFPRSRFTGYESTASALEEAREEVSRRRLRNLHFVERDGPPLHAQSAFDLILTAASSWRAPQVLRRLFQALRSRGWLLLQEPASLGRNPHAPPTPLAPFLYTISCLYRTPLLLGPSRDASAAVPSDHEQTRRLLATAGFGTVEQHVLPGDRIHAVLLARRTS